VNIAYLISAHNNPAHLKRLIAALQAPNTRIFVHIDRKSDFAAFQHLVGPDVTFCADRVAVYWGEYSQIDATLVLLRSALHAPMKFDYFVFLSGTDYPVRSQGYIEDFFVRHAGQEFINIISMPSVELKKPLTRLTQYRVPTGSTMWFLRRVIRRVLITAHVMSGLRDFRSTFQELKPYAGSQWWALSQSACMYIFQFIGQRPEVVKYFHNTWFPDEMFFQTILGNSAFSGRITHNVTFTDWSAGGAHPAPIDERHLALFAAPEPLRVHDAYGNGESLFARKFSDRQATLIDALDKILAAPESRTPSRAAAS
jgi:hypothetical protein